MSNAPIKEGDTLYVAWFTGEEEIEVTGVIVKVVGRILLIDRQVYGGLGRQRRFYTRNVDKTNRLSRTKAGAIDSLHTRTRRKIKRTKFTLKRQEALLAVFDKPTGETP